MLSNRIKNQKFYFCQNKKARSQLTELQDGSSSSEFSFGFRSFDQPADQHGIARLVHLYVNGNLNYNQIKIKYSAKFDSKSPQRKLSNKIIIRHIL